MLLNNLQAYLTNLRPKVYKVFTLGVDKICKEYVFTYALTFIKTKSIMEADFKAKLFPKKN